MKKQIVLALILALAAILSIAFVSCNKQPELPEHMRDKYVEEPEYENKNLDGISPGDKVPFHGYTDVTFAADPTMDENGNIVLKFNEKITFNADTNVYISLLTSGSAESINAKADVKASEGMWTEEGYTGIVIKPSTKIAAGTYEFSISIGNRYLVEFEYTVK